MTKANKDLESKLVSRVESKTLLSFVHNYLAVHDGRMDILELMTRMNLWLEDTLRLARYMIEKGLAKAEKQEIVIDAPKVINQQVLRQYQWLSKWDIEYKAVLVSSPKEQEIIDRFNGIIQGRPSNNDKIDQYYNTVETNLKRVRLLSREPQTQRKSICFLGDDDLTSIMVALARTFPEIFVYDIDPRIIGFVNRTSERLGNNRFRGVLYDYRGIPVESTKFDVFHSDPPATIEAVDLVLKRAREMATPMATFYLSWPEFICDPDYLVGLQRTYADNGWLVTGKFPEFNEYDNACFFNYITDDDRVTLKMFGLTDADVINSPPMQRYCLTRLLLVAEPGIKAGRSTKEIYLSNLHKIPEGKFVDGEK